jgi:hypothetical protein
MGLVGFGGVVMALAGVFVMLLSLRLRGCVAAVMWFLFGVALMAVLLVVLHVPLGFGLWG